jgi:hypothetical protein
MSMRMRLTIGALVAVGSFSIAIAYRGTARAAASSKEGSMVPSVVSAVTLDGGAEPIPATPMVTESEERRDAPGDGVAALFTLLGFLGLIAGNLLRWSGDSSANANRSVFSSSRLREP